MSEIDVTPLLNASVGISMDDVEKILSNKREYPTIAIYDIEKEKVLYIDSIQTCYKDSISESAIEIDMKTLDGDYECVTLNKLIDNYVIGKEEMKVILEMIDDTVQEYLYTDKHIR